MLHAVVLYYMGWSWRISLTESLLNNIILCAVSLAVANILKFYRPGKNKAVNLLLCSFTISVLWSLGIYTLLYNIYCDNELYIVFLNRSMLVRFCIAFLMIGCAELISWVWNYIQEQQEILERNAETQQLAKDAELANLRQQLQPHFLFNSLNSISALIGSQPQEARSMIQKLSDFLRGTLRKDEQKLVTLNEEFETLQLYLDIEKVRFGQRLRTEIIYDDTCNSCKLPALILQPVVENAIKFGLYDTVGEVIITIEAKYPTAEGNELNITIKNPFDPQTTSPKQGTGFGLASVTRRLYLIYGQQNLLTTQIEDNIFITQITIPQL